MKFTVCFEMKVRTAPYENITVSLNKEFDDEKIKPDQAFTRVRDKVMDWIDTELVMLGLEPHSMEASHC